MFLQCIVDAFLPILRCSNLVALRTQDHLAQDAADLLAVIDDEYPFPCQPCLLRRGRRTRAEPESIIACLIQSVKVP